MLFWGLVGLKKVDSHCFHHEPASLYSYNLLIEGLAHETILCCAVPLWNVHTYLLYPIPVHSQPMLGPGDCHANLTLDTSDVILNAPPGTVCIQCVFNNVVAMDATFQIDNTNIHSSKGRVVNGVLVVFDTASVFNTVNIMDIQCSSAGGTHNGAVYLMSKSYSTA